jgi:hypothetical protein
MFPSARGSSSSRVTASSSSVISSARRAESEPSKKNGSLVEWAIPGVYNGTASTSSQADSSISGLPPGMPSSGNKYTKSSNNVANAQVNTMVISTEHGVNVYSCSLCNVRFVSQSLLNRHVQYSTMHSEALARKQQRQLLLNSRSAADTDTGLSTEESEEDFYSDEDDYGYDEEFEEDCDGEEDSFMGDKFNSVTSTSSGAPLVLADSLSDSLHSKTKKVHFSPNQPTREQVELEAFVDDLMLDSSIGDEDNHGDFKPGRANPGWSRAVSKIRMHNEFARVNQLLCAHYHQSKREDRKMQASGPASKILFEGTKFIKTSPSTGESVELVVRHLDDEQTKHSTPGNTSVVEVMGYYAGTGRQSEIGRTYLSYNSLTILLHDEIKKAAAEYKTSSTTKATVPAGTALTSAANASNTTAPIQQPPTDGSQSTKVPSLAIVSRKDGVIALNEKDVSAPGVATSATSPQQAGTTSTKGVLVLPLVIKTPSPSAGAGNALFTSPPRSSIKAGPNSSRPLSPPHSSRTAGTKPRGGSRARRSFERDPRSDRMQPFGKSATENNIDEIVESGLSQSLSSTQLQTQQNGKSERKGAGAAVLASASAATLLQRHHLQGYGHHHHDGIERRMTADVIVHFILSHITLDRLYVGGAYTMHIVSSGARVGEVLGVMLDKFSNTSSHGKH